jgi:hypothetical protein
MDTVDPVQLNFNPATPTVLNIVVGPGCFDGLGGMAFIADWWGVWHLISGLGIATYWSRRPVPLPEAT